LAPFVAPEQFGPKNQKKTLYYLYKSLVPQTISVDPEPTFQASVPPSKIIGSGSSHAKLFRVWLHTPAAYIRLIHISLSCWTIYRSFEIILETELSTGLECKSNVPYKSIA